MTTTPFTTDDRARLLELLRQRSLMFGDFTLASGQKSKFYFDSKKTTLTAEGSYLTALAFLDVATREGIDAVAIGGMTLGADPIVAPVAALSHGTARPLDAFIVRKESKGMAPPVRSRGICPSARVSSSWTTS